eukprot:6970811-Prymnesium_polylepis.2
MGQPCVIQSADPGTAPPCAAPKSAHSTSPIAEFGTRGRCGSCRHSQCASRRRLQASSSHCTVCGACWRRRGTSSHAQSRIALPIRLDAAAERSGLPTLPSVPPHIQVAP